MDKLKLKIEGKTLIMNYDKHFSNLTMINQSLNQGAAQQYQDAGLIYVDVPEVVGITGACENVDTLFKVGNSLDLPLFITQTGQLSLEQTLQTFHGAYTVIHSGRDEEKEDERHLRQFRLTEEEFDCTLAGMKRGEYDEEKMYESLLLHIQKSIQAMIAEVLNNNSKILEKEYGRSIEKLISVTKNNFLRISYEDAVKLLQKNGDKKVAFGDDLKAEHEAKIVALLNKKGEEFPVFIMKYPKEIKFFNMKVSENDPRVVLSADLVFPYSGEATGSAVREHNFEKLKNRLLISKMYELHLKRGGKLEDFEWYLNIIKSQKSHPHAGYGIGNERVLQFIFGESDIRNVSVFSLLDKQSGDWSPSKYGQMGVLTIPKKHILLSIGKESNKKVLLPYIKELVEKDHVVLYATEKTHAFFKKNGVMTSLVHKISEIGIKPNIFDLLGQQTFDLIINIPTRDEFKESKEFTDGKLIRRFAVETGVSIVTDPEVAAITIGNLSK
jgi:asparaginyl-tRNA synthetase